MERLKRALEKARVNAGRPKGPPDASPLPLAPQTTTAVGSRGVLAERARAVAVDPMNLERHRIVAGNKEDLRTASFDLLRTQVLREMRNNGYRTLAVTSPVAQCGKTTLAINLALSIASRTDPSVLLGDFDFRRPKIAEYLGIRPDRDLSDYLSGDALLEEVLVDPGIPNLLLLPNLKARRGAAEALTSPHMRSLMEALKTADMERVYVLDLPPMLPTDDTMSFLPYVDAVLMVVADGSTKKPDLDESLRLLTGAPLLGVVLNKSDAKLRSYY